MAACIDVVVQVVPVGLAIPHPRGEANGKKMWPAARPGPRAARRRVTQ